MWSNSVNRLEIELSVTVFRCEVIVYNEWSC
jgi:hypothetical protein